MTSQKHDTPTPVLDSPGHVSGITTVLAPVLPSARANDYEYAFRVTGIDYDETEYVQADNVEAALVEARKLNDSLDREVRLLGARALNPQRALVTL